MARPNDYNLVMGIVARVIRASADGDRNSILVEPDVHFLTLAKKLIFFISSSHTDLAVAEGKLSNLDPILINGCWSTRGRFGNSMPRVLGPTELPILLHDDMFSYLLMVKAHRENHKEAKTTVSRSCTSAWIVRATSLVKVLVNSFNFCKFKRKILLQQRMGNLPIERANVLSPPWYNVSLDQW